MRAQEDPRTPDTGHSSFSTGGRVGSRPPRYAQSSWPIRSPDRSSKYRTLYTRPAQEWLLWQPPVHSWEVSCALSAFDSNVGA